MPPSRSPSNAPTEALEDAEIFELARRVAQLTLSVPPNSSRSDATHSNVSCYSFLRSLLSTRRPRSSTSRSDPGVVPPPLNASLVGDFRASANSLFGQQTSANQPVNSENVPEPATTATAATPIDTVAGIPPSLSVIGLSLSDLERIHDAAQKRSKNAELPTGGLYKGNADVRTIEAFLQQVHRCPSWTVGSVPSFFRSFYLERCLDESVRVTIVDVVDRELQDAGLQGYDRLLVRAGKMEQVLRERFNSIHAQGVLVEQWQSLRWSPTQVDFESFYLKSQQVAEAYSRQRGESLRPADLSSRLFSSLPSDLKEDVIVQYGPCPSFDDLLRYCRRKNLVYVRRRDAKLAIAGNRNLPSKTPVGAIDHYSDPPIQEVPAMPVEDAATNDVNTQTDCRLFVSNLSYEVNEKQVLDALRSVLRLSGVVPMSVRLFRDRDTGRNRGLGLIEFRDPGSASKALSLNGKRVLGRPIRVRPDNGGQRAAKRQRVETEEAPQEVKEENDTTAVQVGAVKDNIDDSVNDLPSRSETAYVVEAIANSTSTTATECDVTQPSVTINLKNIGIKAGGSSSLTTIRTDILLGSGTPGSTHAVEWLLDSGCALHLISDSESEWLDDARIVPLPSPVRLSFANGASQLVTEAREITLQCANRTYCTSVLVVPKLAVRGILSLHQLVHDFGSVVWHLSAPGKEVLQLGRHVLLQSSGNDCLQQPEGSVCAAVNAVPSLAFVQSFTDEKFSDGFLQSLQEGYQEEVVQTTPPGSPLVAFTDSSFEIGDTCPSQQPHDTAINVDYVDDENGKRRARVSLPWLSDQRPTSKSPGLRRDVAMARDVATRRKLANMGPEWIVLLKKEVESMIGQGHIRPLTAAELADDPPMMAAVTALRPGHPTQPIRVTVDARPVNCFLSSGDTSVLRRALRSILIRWRLTPWVCFDDITRAFLQVMLLDQDSRALNFWILGRGFQCCRLPFGLSPSPACLSATIQDIRTALNIFRECMDDLLYNAWQLLVLLERRSTGRKALEDQAQMECQPSKSILTSDPAFRSEAEALGLADELTVKVASQLGYLWDTVNDTVCPRLIDCGAGAFTTRRSCFKWLGKYFDPIGTNIEIAARQRRLLHEVSETTDSWDSLDLSQEMAENVRSLCQTSPIPYPRFVDTRKGLVVFCDASGSGCICADARGVSDGRRLLARQKTLSSKWTIARLELCALCLGLSTLSEICEELDALTIDGFAVPQIWLLTDSQLNCWRLRRPESSDAKYLQVFERRRVQLLRTGLQKLSNDLRIPIRVGHVSGKANPADRATRPELGVQEMLQLTGDDMNTILESVSTTTTFGIQEADAEIEVPDELESYDSIEPDYVVSLVAAVQLHKDVPPPVEDSDLHWMIKVSQTANPKLKVLFDKVVKGVDTPGYEAKNDLLYKVGNVALDDSNRGSCAVSQIVIPDVDHKLQTTVVEKVHNQHGGHPGRVTLLRWVWRHYYWHHMDKTVRRYNDNCIGCQSRRTAANRRRAMSARPPACSAQYGPFAVAYFDTIGPYKLCRSGQDTATDIYAFTLCCHASKFIKVLPSHNKTGWSAAQALHQMLCDEGTVRVLAVDQGLMTKEVAGVAKDWNFLVIPSPPRGEELRGWGERGHRDLHAVLRGALWSFGKTPTENEFVRLLSRSVAVVNTTPYVDSSPLSPAIICRGHTRTLSDPFALREAQDIKNAILEGLEPPSWWDDMTADMYMREVQAGQDVSLRELADVWWIRRRTVRTKLLARSARHAGRALKVGTNAFRWRPAIGQFGKLNSGWQPCTILSSPTDSTRKVKLEDGKESIESVLNLRPGSTE